MTKRLHDKPNVTMKKDDFDIETFPESRSWKKRKKYTIEDEVFNNSILVLFNIPSDETSHQSLEKSLSFKSSGSLKERIHRQSNHVPRLRGEQKITSKITIYPHYLKKLISAYLSIIIQQLLICMPMLTTPFCNKNILYKKQCLYKREEKLRKRKNDQMNSFPIHFNLMGVCSLSTQVFYLLILTSTLGTVCHALKNEFCKLIIFC